MAVSRKIVPSEIGHLITENLFITITNANFDEEAIKVQIDKTLIAKSELLRAISEVKTYQRLLFGRGVGQITCPRLLL